VVSGLGANIENYLGSATTLSIPEVLGGYTVTSITESAFAGNNSLVNVTIPSGVQHIYDDGSEGGSLFFCSKLKNIFVASGNSRYSDINGVLFSKNHYGLECYPKGRTATKYSIPKGVGYIEGSAFQGNTFLRKVSIPDGVYRIGHYAFNDCKNLQSINMPLSVVGARDDIGAFRKYAFSGCDKLKISCFVGSEAHFSAIYYDIRYKLISDKKHNQIVSFNVNGSNASVNPYIRTRYYEDFGEEDGSWVQVEDAVEESVYYSGKIRKELRKGSVYGILPTATRPGYLLKGWYTKKKGGKKIGESTKVKSVGKITLYAHWTPKTKEYTVIFKAGGKTLSKKVNYGMKYGRLPYAKDRSGQLKFLGWYTKKTGGKKITPKSVVKITKTTMLYAHWRRR
jgi:uncharacterized repeat protein (TIGR02543 family)